MPVTIAQTGFPSPVESQLSPDESDLSQRRQLLQSRAWASKALQCLDQQIPCALVSILATAGSTPREAGTRMLVTKNEIVGTIGGGRLEQLAIEQARKAIDQPTGTWRVQDYPLGSLLSQCCGGRVQVLVEHVDERQGEWLTQAASVQQCVWRVNLLEDRIERELLKGITPSPTNLRSFSSSSKPGGEKDLSSNMRLSTFGPGDSFLDSLQSPTFRVVLFGAGHVGQAIARIFQSLPLQWEWMDERSEYQKLGHLRIVSRDTMVDRASQQADCILVITHDHALDYKLVYSALRGPAGWVGLIGSKTKRERFLSHLSRDGINAESVSKLRCPIGLPGIHGKEPEVIAVSVTAQVLELRHARSLPS